MPVYRRTAKIFVIPIQNIMHFTKKLFQRSIWAVKAEAITFRKICSFHTHNFKFPRLLCRLFYNSIATLLLVISWWAVVSVETQGRDSFVQTRRHGGAYRGRAPPNWLLVLPQTKIVPPQARTVPPKKLTGSGLLERKSRFKLVFFVDEDVVACQKGARSDCG